MPRKTSEKLIPDTTEQLIEQETVLADDVSIEQNPQEIVELEAVETAAPEEVEMTAPEAGQDDAPPVELPLQEPVTTDIPATPPMRRYEYGSDAPMETAEPVPPSEPAELSAAPEPSSEPAAKAAKTRAAKTKAAKSAKTEKAAKTAKTDNAEQSPASARRAFYSLDFRALDRDLSPEQEQEWNSIYASFRSGSILTGTVAGVDEHTFDITDEQGKTQRRTVQSLVLIGYRVKVVIPETEVWAVGEENSRYATRSMVGAKVDYVILNVDRENDCAIASRRMAMTKRRRHFSPDLVGRELMKCDVILAAQKVLLVNCGGFDLILTQKDLSYTAIADLRTDYKPGMELTARLLDTKDGKPVISVKEVNPNPFDGAELRHPVGCRRQAVIEGKYAGGVFCRLLDDTTCLCLYSNNHYDTEFYTGDTVLIYITEFDYNRKLIYGRIVAKR